MRVTGPANRTLLAEKILDFCGVFPIYSVEKVDKRTLIKESIGEWIKFSYVIIEFTEKYIIFDQFKNMVFFFFFMPVTFFNSVNDIL